MEIHGRDQVTNDTFIVGENCEILYLEAASKFNPYGNGIEDTIEIYAQKLANADASIDTNLLVSRTPWLFEVENQNEAQAARLMFTGIMSGKPAVFIRKPKLDPTSKRADLVTRMPVKENFVADVVQDSKRSILNEFLTVIGVNNANTDKRERLITDEVNANNEELSTAVSLWQQNAGRCLKKIKEMFGDKLDGNFEIEFGGGANASINRPNGTIPNQNERDEE